MKSLVIYTSRTGNTEKVADAIAEVVDAEAINVDSISDRNEFWSEYDDSSLVFIGSGVYANNTSKELLQLLHSVPQNKGLNFAIFATWLGRGQSAQKMISQLTSIIKSRGASIFDENYLCFGKSFGLIRRNHPDQSELEDAGSWAKKVIDYQG